MLKSASFGHLLSSFKFAATYVMNVVLRMRYDIEKPKKAVWYLDALTGLPTD